MGKRLAVLFFAGLLFGRVALGGPLSAVGTLANLNDAVSLLCPNGQSSADVHVGSGLTGTVTVLTSSASVAGGGAAGYGAPLWSAVAGGTAYAQTLSVFPGDLYVTLGSQPWVEAVLTTATGGSALATVTCSAAVARASATGTQSVSGTAPITVSAGPTPAVGCATCVTSVSAGSNIVLSGTSTAPVVGVMDAPTFGGTVITGGSFLAGSSTYGPTSATVNGALSIAGTNVNPTTGQTTFSTNATNLDTNFNAFAPSGQFYFFNNTGADWAPINTGAITLQTGSLTAGSSTYGPTSASVAGIIAQPGYAQHGVVTVTTPATCTALTACGTASVTFSPAMTTAPGCVATAQNYPQLVTSNVPTTTAVTFTLYTLVAVASSQTVPVAYSCLV